MKSTEPLEPVGTLGELQSGMDSSGSQPLSIGLEGEKCRWLSVGLEGERNRAMSPCVEIEADGMQPPEDDNEMPRDTVNMLASNTHHPNGPTEPPDEKERGQG
ncbi:hypothetical protein PAXRUDRAFT_156163 [Paxillus rubicundulus Ve08.2h10]|uniref:Uncharacterized protein n=1 Tax=Paxillus rubicundulus Ve08.2h10 TaxID=930991 RepID=A0A0D0DQ84_9AGAM|nr:hypothetical protein PAXRUDRAFT_156163 [Paxillus rubicundulus Ve08.2h10]